jgi:hypothetical protein
MFNMIISRPLFYGDGDVFHIFHHQHAVLYNLWAPVRVFTAYCVGMFCVME